MAAAEVPLDVVLLPSAYETAAAPWWDTLYPASALANGQWWIMANQHGDNGGPVLYESLATQP
jgi:predicted amidohydrolase